MNKNQLPPLSQRLGESAVRKAQKKRGYNKVPDFLYVLTRPSKRMQRITSSKIQHAHSGPSSVARRTVATMPDHFPPVPDRFPTAFAHAGCRSSCSRLPLLEGVDTFAACRQEKQG